MLAGELLILNEDHDIDCFLLALDRKTGKKVWRTAREGFTRSYSTPVIRVVDGSDQVIVAGSRQLVGYDLASGQKRWWSGGLARVVIPTPTQTDDRHDFSADRRRQDHREREDQDEERPCHHSHVLPPLQDVRAPCPNWGKPG